MDYYVTLKDERDKKAIMLEQEADKLKAEIKDK
jgi:hypothetical protein